MEQIPEYCTINTSSNILYMGSPSFNQIQSNSYFF